MPRLKPQAAAKRASNPLGRDFSESLSRGLQIITTFGPSARALTLSEVARRVDLPRATARRSLLTLAQMGYVQEEGRLFSLTPRVLELAVAYLSASPAATILQPCCERLAAECGETFSVFCPRLDESGGALLFGRPVRAGGPLFFQGGRPG